MEFNPLDLLASAAELQQRHDEPPNIMTRQKKASTLPTSKIITISTVPKDNRHAKSGKNNGVIVVKKIKFGANSDLDKMLDEHNYGNAKKGIKFERNLNYSSDGLVSDVGSVTTSRDVDQEQEEQSGEHEIDERLVVTEAETSITKSPVASGSHSIDLGNGVNKTPDNFNSVLPEVHKENTAIKSTALGTCSSDKSIKIDKDDKQEGLSPDSVNIVKDSINVQTDKMRLHELDDKMCNDVDSKTNKTVIQYVKTEKVNSYSCLENIDTDLSDHTKKVVVKVSPENNIFIERKTPAPAEDKTLQIGVKTDSVESKISDRVNMDEKTLINSHQPSILLKDHNNIKSVTVIKSLLTSDNNSVRSLKTKFHNGSLRVNCDTENYLRVLEEKMESCDSPKSQLDLDPFCNSSSNGIHLLSPDRRNPDSVGVVESPLNSAFTDSSNCETENETEKSEDVPSPKEVLDKSRITVVCNKNVQNKETQNLQNESNPEIANTFNETCETRESKQKVVISVKEPSEEPGPSHSETKSETCSVFRFDSDHCYAGQPGRINNVYQRELPSDEETDTDEEEEEGTSSPDTSPTELSQDSGYGDITQSPVSEKKEDNSVKPNPEKLVPVLISFNKSGALTVHTDKGVSKELPKQIFTLADNQTLDSNANLLNMDKGQTLNKPTTVTSNVRPLLLSPIGKGTASVLIDPSKISLVDPKSVTNLVSPPVKTTQCQQVSPPKFGKFRIGSFASFSNAGMDIDSPVKGKSKSERTSKSPFQRSASHPHNLSSLKSSAERSLLRNMDFQKGSSSVSLPLGGYDNHIQHDHDYCTHNVMPSTIDSAKEKETTHKSGHVKPKKYESELEKHLLKNDKPKKRGKNVKNTFEKDDSNDELELMLDEERYRDLPTYKESVRSKSRSERYIEQKSSEPKMKITGSSKFQDQFVYFMNTKKRSRRRESRESHVPFQVPYDKIILPPHKPGDIVVPHLTDADIENLKLFNKQNKTNATATSSEYSDSFSSKLNLANSQSTNSESNADEESKIINTILSLENESLTEEQIPYSENMEMYGQNDIMNLLPEQMNLTQEQMELLFSAVDEVQNSSPSLVSDKLDSGSGDATFGHFPSAEQGYTSTAGEETVTESGDKGAENIVKKNTDAPRAGAVTPEVKSSGLEKRDENIGSSGLSSDQELVDSKQKDSLLTNCENDITDNNPVTNAGPNVNIIRETPAALSEVINDTVTTGTFTSLNQNSDSETGENNLGQVGTSSSVFSNLTSSVNPDLPLPALDRSSLELLNSDYKLDRSDLFSDTSVQETPHQLVPSSLPVTSSSSPLDYNAPWIVTVSMYWNDLPAIMINNLPYIRLVDIHKQILPAKDTGILKKRCQLMGIEVENCTEMQRYFLVQYGKAINSKSTLIVSKDAAKELIGYYVEPQPAKPPGKEHKSIIEHRREQLRRIALAKRAALRAEKLEKEKAGSNLLKPVDGNVTNMPLGVKDAPRQRSQSMSSEIPYTISPSSRSQRSTRHKKINFLELLRGDSSASLADNEETSTNEGSNKKKIVHEDVPSVKPGTKRKRSISSGDRKRVKIVKYVESETSESDSEYTEEDFSDSTESDKVVVVNKPKKKKSMFNHKPKKRRFNKSVVLKKNVVKVPSFKVKFKQAKHVSKAQIKQGKDGSISRVHIVKMSSDYEKPIKKQPVKKNPLVKENSYHTENKFTKSSESEVNTESRVREKFTKHENESTLKTVENREGHGKEITISTETPRVNNDKETDTNDKNDEGSTEEIINKRGETIQQNKLQDKENGQDQLNDTSDSTMITNNSEMDKEMRDEEYRNYNPENSVEEISEKANSLDEYVLAMINVSKDTKLEKADSEIKTNSLEPSVQSETKDADSEIVKPKPVNAGSLYCVENQYSEDVSAESCKNEIDMDQKTSLSKMPDKINSGKTGSSNRITPTCSNSNLSEGTSRAASRCSENSESTGGDVNFYLLNKDTDVVEESPPVLIVHRDATPQSNGVRTRRQLGEIFVEHYINKRSFCIRCYTCRKMLSVDHFMKHLHDVSGGLVSTDVPQIIEPSDSNMSDLEIKAWEVFQRKKELFDNNQLPSDVGRSNIVYNVDSDSNLSVAEKSTEEPRGPIIKHTPVSPIKRDRLKVTPKPEQRTRKKIPALLQQKTNKVLEKSKSWCPKESPKESKDGIRASSRKRKASQLYSSEEYTFYKKLPRLQNE